jgi:hypothetical protein
MSKKSTCYELDLNNPPPLTPQQQAELEALKAMPDEAIDYSDIVPFPCFLSSESVKVSPIHKDKGTR